MWLHESQICSINIWYAVPWYADFDRYVTCPIMPNGYSNSESQMCYSCYVCIRNNDYLMVLTQVHCINQHCCHTRAMPASWKMENIRFTLYIRMNFLQMSQSQVSVTKPFCCIRCSMMNISWRAWEARCWAFKYYQVVVNWMYSRVTFIELFSICNTYRLKNILHIPWPVSI